MRSLPWRIGYELWRWADGASEKFGVGRHAAQTMVAKALGRQWESTLTLKGRRYAVLVGGSEVGGYYEVHVQRAYEHVPGFAPSDGSVVLDIGANVGAFAIKHASAGARVFAFEPNPTTYERLRRNVDLNALGSRVSSYPFALGSEIGTAGLDRAASTGTTRVLFSRGSDVAVRTLDDVTSEVGIGRVSLIKLDVEGAEVEALRGGPRTLNRTQRVVLEYHSEDLRRQARDTLLSSGFKELSSGAGYAYYGKTST